MKKYLTHSELILYNLFFILKFFSFIFFLFFLEWKKKKKNIFARIFSSLYIL
jgi:hypothetical protein